MDEGSLLVYPERMLHGDVPNRDFQTLYGPGNAVLLAAAFEVFGPSLAVERSVGALYRAAIVVALVVLISGQGAAIATLTGVIALIFLASLLAFAWFGGLALALWSLVLLTRGRQLLLAGILGGVALVFRPDLVLAVGLLVVGYRSSRYVRGVLVGLVAYVPFILVAGPTNVFRGLVLDAFRSNPARRLPLPFASPLLWLVLGSTLTLVVCAVVESRRGRDRVFLGAALLSVGLLPQALQRADAWHLVAAGCVAVALAPAALVALFGSVPRMVAAIAGAITVVGLTLDTVMPPTIIQSLESIGVRAGTSYALSFRGRVVYVSSAEESTELSRLMADVEARTEPGDRLFVGPRDLRRSVYNDTFLYFLLPDLTPATYFLEMNPGLPNRPGSRLAADVASADIVILSDLYNDWNEPNASRSQGPPDAELAIRRDFCSASRFGPWEVLESCSPPRP